MLNVPEGDSGSMAETMVCVNAMGAISTLSPSQKQINVTILPSTTATGTIIIICTRKLVDYAL